MTWLEDLREVIQINSYTQNKTGVDAVGIWFEKRLEKLGFTCTRHTREVIGDHLFFTSQICEGEKVLLLGHIDTVFPLDTFEGFRSDEEWVYGPGVCDMKGGNIVALKALETIYDKYGKIENIDFLLVSDEESGSDDSKHLTAKIAKEYDYCFDFEAAGINEDLVVGRKGIATFYADITGKAAHAGVAFTKGIDANLEAAQKLVALNELCDLDKGTVLNVGKIQGGVGANTRSPSSSLVFETRFSTNDERDRVLAAVQNICDNSYVQGTTCNLQGGMQREVMEANEAQSKLIAFFEKLSGQKLPMECRGGVSDANVTAGCGVLSIDGFGPYGDGDHTKNERANIESFERRIELCEKIFDYHQNNKKLM